MNVKWFIESFWKTARHAGQRATQTWRHHWWYLRRPSAISPVFVVGCSRSGTTLVYRTLSLAREPGTLNRETHDFWMALHPLAERNWESHVIGPENASKRDQWEVEHFFYVHTGKRRFVDKNNQNSFSIPYLKALFPDAHFVFVKRNPGDTILSMMGGWNRPEAYGTWAEDLPAEVRIDGGRCRRWCFFLPPGWRDHLHDSLIDVCTWQYRCANEAVLSARHLVPAGQWHEIRYEDILDDPAGAFQALFDACGFRFAPAIRRHCLTVLERPYNASSPIGKDKWKNHEMHADLGEAVHSLGTLPERLGYRI